MPVSARWVGVTTGMLVVGAIAVASVAGVGGWLPETSAQTTPRSSKIDVAAADRKTVTMQFGGWRVTCDEAGSPPQEVCSAAYRVVDRNTNATILTWMLGRSSEGRLLTEFFVPTEVLIRPGVSMSLDNGPTYTAEYVACGRSACKAVLPLDAALLSELRNATEAKISLAASNGKVTQFTMAIEGIEAALAELR